MIRNITIDTSLGNNTLVTVWAGEGSEMRQIASFELPGKLTADEISWPKPMTDEERGIFKMKRA